MTARRALFAIGFLAAFCYPFATLAEHEGDDDQRPNLRVLNFQATRNGQNVNYSVSIENDGQGPAGQFQVALYFKENSTKPDKVHTINALPKGGKKRTRFIWKDALASLPATSKVVVDAGNRVIEINDDDNTATTTVEAPPNLTVHDLKVSYDGEDVLYDVTVANVGKTAAGRFHVGLVYGPFEDAWMRARGVRIADETKPVQGLAGNASVTLKFRWEKALGHLPATSTAIADIRNDVTEMNERDNEKSVTVEPPMPNLTISEFHEETYGAGPVDVFMVVRNEGPGAAGPFDVTVRLKGDDSSDEDDREYQDAARRGPVIWYRARVTALEHRETVQGLAPGASQIITAGWVDGQKVLPASLEISIDPDNRVPESNDKDNTESKRLEAVARNLTVKSFSAEIRGSDVHYTTTISYTGKLPIQGFDATLRFRAEGFEHERKSVSRLILDGQQETLNFIWKDALQRLPATSTVAVRTTLPETTLEDNSQSRELKAPLKPNLQIAAFDVETDEQDVHYTVKVANVGEGDAGPFDLAMYFGGPSARLFGEDPAADPADEVIRIQRGIPAGKHETRKFTWENGIEHLPVTSTVVADASYEVDETEDYDNTKTQRVLPPEPDEKGDDGDTTPQTAFDIVLRVETQPSKAVLTIELVNKVPEPFVLGYKAMPEFVIRVRSSHGKQVFKFGEGAKPLPVLHGLAHGEKLTFQATWDYKNSRGNLVRPGTYKASGRIARFGVKPAEFSVLGEEEPRVEEEPESRNPEELSSGEVDDPAPQREADDRPSEDSTHTDVEVDRSFVEILEEMGQSEQLRELGNSERLAVNGRLEQLKNTIRRNPTLAFEVLQHILQGRSDAIVLAVAKWALKLASEELQAREVPRSDSRAHAHQ